MTNWDETRLAYSPELLLTLMFRYSESMSKQEDRFPLLVPCVKYFCGMVAMDCFADLAPRSKVASKEKMQKNITKISIEYPREYRILDANLSEALLLGLEVGALQIKGIEIATGDGCSLPGFRGVEELVRMKKWTEWLINKRNARFVMTELGVSSAI